MKKYIIYIALCLLTFKAKACDACGCAATGGGLGFTSVFDQKYVGIRYMYQSYHTKDGVYNNSPYVQDHFNTVQLWGRTCNTTFRFISEFTLSKSYFKQNFWHPIN